MATRKKYKIVLSEKYVHKSENGKEWFQFPVNISGQLVAIQTIIPLDPYTEPDMEKVREEAYEQGLSDAWECARKIADIPYGEEEKVFGSGGWTFIANHTAQEAIKEIRQYEQEKEEEIQVGDEIENKMTKSKGVVVMDDEDSVQCLSPHGTIFCVGKSRCIRIGHFPEIAEVFAKMKETDNG